jgi:hypothetical protein
MGKQFCAICAWRENCNKKFCVPDSGAHCPDFTRDISLRDDTCQEESTTKSGAEGRERI